MTNIYTCSANDSITAFKPAVQGFGLLGRLVVEGLYV